MTRALSDHRSGPGQRPHPLHSGRNGGTPARGLFDLVLVSLASGFFSWVVVNAILARGGP